MATGNTFEIFGVDAIDAGALLHQIAGPSARVRIALLIGEAGGATHSGGRSNILAFLPGLTDHPRLGKQFGRRQPVQPRGRRDHAGR